MLNNLPSPLEFDHVLMGDFRVTLARIVQLHLKHIFHVHNIMLHTIFCTDIYHMTNTIRLETVVLLLGQRRRWWPNIKPTVG